jgi:hypothetical protein
VCPQCGGHRFAPEADQVRRGRDARDAADLADLLRLGRLPEAWLTPPEIRDLREMVRGRHIW